MPSYKRMYIKLFNDITDIIERLRQAQRDTEEMYMRDDPIHLEESEPNKNNRTK